MIIHFIIQKQWKIFSKDYIFTLFWKKTKESNRFWKMDIYKNVQKWKGQWFPWKCKICDHKKILS